MNVKVVCLNTKDATDLQIACFRNIMEGSFLFSILLLLLALESCMLTFMLNAIFQSRHNLNLSCFNNPVETSEGSL
jgi:hypothetical protein